MTRVVLRYAREAAVEDPVVRDAYRVLGVPSVKLTPRGRRHHADRMFFVPGGKPKIIEFKRPGDEPRRSQSHVHKILRDLGYDVEVHDTYAGAMGSLAAAVDAARWPA
jgi:hypothetical protein